MTYHYSNITRNQVILVKKRKIPMRMCIGCREMKPKKELIRVVRDPEGNIDLDLKGKAPGRGAYVCPLHACIDKADRTKLLEKTFGQKISAEVYARLKGQLNEGDSYNK